MKKMNLESLPFAKKQKLTREQLKTFVGASGAGSTFCHFYYTGKLWESSMKITKCGKGGCTSSGGSCYSYYQTGSDCSC
ncbi:hypothetical protein [Chryseobacterium sp. JK1]|uniref:hypothetical protein n=1 Tax=Chryseobacterium sp. JK1 TaxID=874294 RepID=UPI003D68C787